MSFATDTDFAALENPRAPTGALSIGALARFEFEPGKSNDGTKILMVEWEDDDLSRSSRIGSWRVEWEGKRAVLPADGHDHDHDHMKRVYFLLPPNVSIPPVVSLTYEPSSGASTDTPGTTRHSLQLNPLPAIFPPELGDTATSAGKKGVLHTVWAKKRLQSLEQEICEECRSNVEGVALQMALQEREWIEENFGVKASTSTSTPTRDGPESIEIPAPAGFTPISPTSPGKMAQKLKGLRLRTGEGDLTPSTISNHPLSPESPDVAVSSFNSFHSLQPSQPINPVQPVPQYPPEPLQQRDYGPSLARTSSTESGEELFAKALSPRSADLPRSPFSFA